MSGDEHDPWNEPAHRHPRANILMAPILWDCVDEEAPFGSDEGADAYVEYREWRATHPGVSLTACLASLGAESDFPDEFTFDATVLATVLGQLVDEGRVDPDVKAATQTAVARQRVGASPRRFEFLAAAEAAIQVA